MLFPVKVSSVILKESQRTHLSPEHLTDSKILGYHISLLRLIGRREPGFTQPLVDRVGQADSVRMICEHFDSVDAYDFKKNILLAELGTSKWK